MPESFSKSLIVYTATLFYVWNLPVCVFRNGNGKLNKMFADTTGNHIDNLAFRVRISIKTKQPV
jgi:hypothetical protein